MKNNGRGLVLCCEVCGDKCITEWLGGPIACGYAVAVYDQPDRPKPYQHVCIKLECRKEAIGNSCHYTVRPINVDWRTRPISTDPQRTTRRAKPTKIVVLTDEELRRQLMQLETHYNMTSVEFLKLYNAGELGDDRDFIHWSGLLRTATKSHASRS